MFLVTLPLPPTLAHDATSITLPSATRSTSRAPPAQRLSFNGIIEGASLDGLRAQLQESVAAQADALFQGASLTYCLYGSLASPAQSLFFESSTGAESPNGLGDPNILSIPSGLNDSNSLEDPQDSQSSQSSLGSLHSLGGRFGSVLLERAQSRGWSVGASAFMIQDSAVFDLLNGRERHAVIDSGSILFMKGMKCFELRAQQDVANVLAALQQAPPAPLPTNAACVLLFQLITPQTQYATRLTLILLPPCDRSTPCMVSQYRGGAQLQFRKNQDMTSALMVLSHYPSPLDALPRAHAARAPALPRPQAHSLPPPLPLARRRHAARLPPALLRRRARHARRLQGETTGARGRDLARAEAAQGGGGREGGKEHRELCQHPQVLRRPLRQQHRRHAPAGPLVCLFLLAHAQTPASPARAAAPPPRHAVHRLRAP